MTEPETTDLEGNPEQYAVDVEPREHDTIAWHPHRCLEKRPRLLRSDIWVITDLALYYMAELMSTNVPQIILCPDIETWKNAKQAIDNVPDDFPNDVNAAMVPLIAQLKWIERYQAFFVCDEKDIKYLDHYIAKYATSIEEGQL